MIEFYSSLVIFLWATWCVLSPSVNDGVVGKLIYAAIAFSALSICTAPIPEFHTSFGRIVALHSAIAALAARHIFMKLCWPHWIQWYNEKKGKRNEAI